MLAFLNPDASRLSRFDCLCLKDPFVRPIHFDFPPFMEPIFEKEKIASLQQL